MKRHKNPFHLLKIRTQILLLYFSVFVLSLMLSVGIFSYISEKKSEVEIAEAAMQTVGALKVNLVNIFENVNQFSNMIYFDPNIQQSLRNSNTADIDPQIQQDMQKSIINMLLSNQYISSVFFLIIMINVIIPIKLVPFRFTVISLRILPGINV